MGNQIRTVLLLGALTGVILWIGNMLGGSGGMLIALIFAGGMNFFSYWYSDKIVLKMYKAREVGPEDDPELHGLVRNLAQKTGIPMPGLYIIPQDAPNAFATGRNPDHAVVAVTRGLLRLMDRQEITGVIAHELGHVKNRDILISSIAATLAGAIMLLASFARWTAIFGGFNRDQNGAGGIFGLIAMAIVAPIAALMIQMAVSRSREYMADTTSSQITGDREGLARALEKLDAYSKKIPMKAEPATAHMFISNPLSGRSIMGLFSTHPPIDQRIARLRGKTLKHSDNDGNNQPPAGGGSGEQFWDRLR